MDRGEHNTTLAPGMPEYEDSCRYLQEQAAVQWRPILGMPAPTDDDAEEDLGGLTMEQRTRLVVQAETWAPEERAHRLALFQTFIGTLMQNVSALLFAVMDDAPGTHHVTTGSDPPHEEEGQQEEDTRPAEDFEESWDEEESDDEEAVLMQSMHPNNGAPVVPFAQFSFMLEALAKAIDGVRALHRANYARALLHHLRAHSQHFHDDEFELLQALFVAHQPTMSTGPPPAVVTEAPLPRRS